MKAVAFFNPQQKLIFIILSALFAITTDNYYLMGGYLCVVIIFFLLSDVDKRKTRIWLAALLLTWWGTVFSQSIFYAKMPRTVLFVILPGDFPALGTLTGGIHIYKEGAEHGLIQAMRFGITITCGLLVCFTTEAKDILRAAIRLKLPYTLSFMVSVALRFIPLIVEETRTVISAQRLRGFTPVRAGIARPVKTARTVLLPILVNSIRRSSMLSLSVESRHFGKHQAFYLPLSRNGKNNTAGLILWAGGIFIIMMAVIKILYFLYISNYLYVSAFRHIYDIAEKYL